MTPPTLAPPPPETTSPGESSVEAPPLFPARPARPLLRRRFGARPSELVPSRALLGSVAVHLALIGLAVVFLRLGPEGLPAPKPGPVAAGEQVEYYDLDFPTAGVGAPSSAPVAGPAAPAAPSAPASAAPAVPQRRRDREQPGAGLVFPSVVPSTLPQAGGAPARAGGGAGNAPAAGQPVGGGAGGNPARPGYRDPRLYVPDRPVPPEPELSDQERYMRHLTARIQEYNDSVAEEQGRARRATDWTVRDKNGGRWGATPDKIYLGKIAVPNVIKPELNTPAEHRREAETRAKQRAEIDRQVSDGEIRDNLRERTKATRERRDAERRREKEKEEGSKGGS